MSDPSTSPNQYHELINDMLLELKEVLDEHVVVKAARNVIGLKITDDAKVEAIEGNPQAIVQGLVDEFIGLSNAVVVKTLQPLLKQCPWIKVPMAQQEQ
jgi:hypothetical protein